LINRGYVYSSHFITDDQAADEFLRRNPKIRNEPRLVRYRSGRYRRNWVGNVAAIGNASGFVEPLEATALAQIIYELRWLAEILRTHGKHVDASQRDGYNQLIGRAWDEIRDFLAFHYKFNTLIDTPFWRHCQNETSLGNFQGFFEAYQVLGPSHELIKHLPHTPNIYGIEGYLAMLVGMRVPHRNQIKPTQDEQRIWKQKRTQFAEIGKRGLSVRQALDAVRSSHWKWPSNQRAA
ncbi:MAG: tryptophan 7-halogenase, partial [Luteolibacter sp.]